MSQRLFEIPPGTSVIARDALAARQWEAFLARGAAVDGARAWRTPSLLGFRTWVAERWAEQPSAAELLTVRQSRALWQRVIAGSPEGERLIDVAAPASWAAQASRLLAEWQIDPRALAAARDQADFHAFLRWQETYRALLEQHGWRDSGGLEAALEPPPIARLILADLDEHDLAPSAGVLLQRLAASGASIERWRGPQQPGVAARSGFASERDELAAALDWAAERLARRPDGRVALVVADLEAARPELDRALAAVELRGPLWDPHRGGIGEHPAIGAALTGVELLSPAASFAALSRWLRSRPLDDPLSGAWARLEAQLRRELVAQLGFREAYQRAGLRQRLQSAAPELARALDDALAATADGGARRTPSGWAAAWQRGLRALGWPSMPLSAEAGAAWEAALTELRRLTPVLGRIGEGQARRELERIVADARAGAPLPVHGLSILGRLEEVGPGYDCAWLTGFTNTHWPRPARLNPLLPRRLQQAHGMPWSSPHDALERSERALDALRARVPEVIISWPASALEQPAEPSPMIVGLPERPMPARAFAPLSPRPIERLADRPPALRARTIRGGAGALNAQARAPLRAFCEYRLHAKALEASGLGLSPRLRGIATHRALELLYAPAAPAATDERLATCAAAALVEAFGAARGGLDALFRLEHERLTEVLAGLRRAEAERDPFAVAAVERHEEVAVGPLTLRLRIDRIDRLAEGGLAVLDYKTGAASANDWLRERPRDVQVPLYAVHLGSGVAAAVIVTLDAGGAGYHGVWPKGAFPARSKPLASSSWEEQLKIWRGQLETLAAELAGGDCRIFLAELDAVRGAYAPLTRICEQLQLARIGDEL